MYRVQIVFGLKGISCKWYIVYTIILLKGPGNPGLVYKVFDIKIV